jgi:hypothetical protein
MEIAKNMDYAPHYLRTKQLLRELHDALNDREVAKSKELSLQLLTEVKLLHNSVQIIAP